MDWTILSLPTSVALALIAVLGYFVGRRSRLHENTDLERACREVRRAKAVAKELETIADTVRKSLAVHHASIDHFKDRVRELSESPDDAVWKDFSNEAEAMLKPTLRLANQLAQAYDEIRQQSNQLLGFTDVHTDPLTRVNNRRALDETLGSYFGLLNRYGQRFSLAIFDIDHFRRVNDEQGPQVGDYALQSVARVLDEAVRETDIVARYGGEEFVVVMPHTGLEGACFFAERLRASVEKELSVTISGGLAEALDGDTPNSLLSRADAALYSAKAAGRNRVFRHTGKEIEPITEELSLST